GDDRGRAVGQQRRQQRGLDSQVGVGAVDGEHRAADGADLGVGQQAAGRYVGGQGGGGEQGGGGLGQAGGAGAVPQGDPGEGPVAVQFPGSPVQNPGQLGRPGRRGRLRLDRDDPGDPDGVAGGEAEGDRPAERVADEVAPPGHGERVEQGGQVGDEV